MTRIGNTKYDVHYFKRFVTNPGTFTGNAITGDPLLQGISFAINGVAGIGEFSALFDQYMLTHVQMMFHLRIDPSAQTATTAIYPKLYWFTDYDDANAPPSLNAVREHPRCKIAVLNPNRPVICNIKPAVLNEVYRSPTTSSYNPKWRQWLDFAQTDVPHYGLKFAIDNFTNTNYIVSTELKFWFACKGVR